MQDTHENRFNGYQKFIKDPYVKEIAINLLVSDPLERTFKIEDELIIVNLVNGIPTDLDIHMKIANMWCNYDKNTKLIYSGIKF
jgi:hypothetical protein